MSERESYKVVLNGGPCETYPNFYHSRILANESGRPPSVIQIPGDPRPIGAIAPVDDKPPEIHVYRYHCTNFVGVAIYNFSETTRGV